MISKRSKKYLKKVRRRAVGRHTSLGAVQLPLRGAPGRKRRSIAPLFAN
jgi:hypothetical protein